MTVETSGKKLSELRVVDLKLELEKRNLDCSGIKAVLVKKLEKALKNEGEDPSTYQFLINSPGASPKKIPSTNGEEKSDDEKPMSDDESSKPDEPVDQPTGDLSDDEKRLVEEKQEPLNQISDDEEPSCVMSDDEKMEASNQLSDDEKAEKSNQLSDDEKQAEKSNQLSDDEKQAEKSNHLSDDEKQAEKSNQLSDDEEEGKGSEPGKQKLNNYAKMSDDEKPDEDKKSLTSEAPLDNKTADENKEETKNMDSQETVDGAVTGSGKDSTSKGEDVEEETDKQSAKPSEEGSNEQETREEEAGKEDDGQTQKKLRPRITAPSDEGKSTKTPVLKKDIKLTTSKAREEEFVVPEQESDIYDKDKFIVQDDVSGDQDEEEPMDFEADMGNMENEDSINLTIGEEDATFMAEEAEMESEEKDATEARAADKKKGADGLQSGNKQLTSSEKKDSNKGKSLWVSGLSVSTRATDLKHLFNKHGKVIAAKIVTNAKTPGARCYGFVTMSTHEDATSCIKALNLTELHGRLISVETVAGKPAVKKEGRQSPHRTERDRLRVRSSSLKSGDHPPNGDRRLDRSGGRDFDRRRFSRDRDRGRRYNQDILSFEQIKAERKKQKAMAVDREMRELSRRKRDEISRQRDVERRNREEAARLEREREKLKYERDRIERERAELLVLERARLEREREELKRQKLRLEEDRILKRTLSGRDEFSRSKRQSPDYPRHYSSSHRSPGRQYDSRYSERGMERKREERKEVRRSRSPRRSPRRRSRERQTSSKSSGKLPDDSERRKCYYCGLPSHLRKDCPAIDTLCPICGKTGHFGSMCSVLGYKYPEPVYYDNYKACPSGEKWPASVEARGPVKTEGWSGRGGPPVPPPQDRYRLEYGGPLPPPPAPPSLSAVFTPPPRHHPTSAPHTPPRPPYSPIRSASSRKRH